jgi:hypothetical protein
MITETDDLAKALEAAALLWPNERLSRSALLRKVLELGTERVLEQASVARTSRLRAIESQAGSLTGVWPDGWRDELRDEWPK